MAVYVLIYSGGLDSTTLLYDLLAKDAKVLPLAIDYGQRHRCELESAAVICRALKLDLQIADLKNLNSFFGQNSQTDLNVAVPDGYYTEETMKTTIVPNRNMLMLSVGLACAISNQATGVAYGAHAGDHAIYPDCRPEFVNTMQQAAKLCDWSSPEIIAPYVNMSKSEIVKRGIELAVPYHLTWSCYKGEAKHCGVCGTCTERKEAFRLAGVSDPTEYVKE